LNACVRTLLSRVGTTLAIAIGALMLFAVIWCAARQVNAASYLAGADTRGTFVPVSYAQDCGRYGCFTVTRGYVSGGGQPLTWPGQVPLGKLRPVHVPVLNWGFTLTPPVTGTSDAAITLAWTVPFELVATFMGTYMVTAGRLPVFRAFERRLNAFNSRIDSAVNRWIARSNEAFMKRDDRD
jgi:hypothetical protein